MKLILKRGAYYNDDTKLCVCDISRQYPVIQSMPVDQRPGYCVQICGAPLEGVRTCDFLFLHTVFHRLPYHVFHMISNLGHF